MNRKIKKNPQCLASELRNVSTGARSVATLITTLLLAVLPATTSFGAEQPLAENAAGGSASVSFVTPDSGALSKGNLILGTASIPDYIGSDDYQLVPLIISNFKLGAAEIVFEGTGARIDIFQDPVLEFGPVLNLSLPRIEVESARVEQLGEVDASLEAGIYTGFAFPYGNLPEGELNGYIAARRSITGDNDGALLIGLLEYFWAVKYFLRVGVNVSVTYADSSYMETHFGVSEAASALSGLPAFDANAGLRDVSFSAYSILSFSRRWGLFGRVLASRLTDDAADSPLVTEEGSRDQYFGGVGLFINFY